MPHAALITPGDDHCPVLLHVPHASRAIPLDLRPDLLLNDADLAAELDESTDTATDEIAAATLHHTRLAPATVINTLSRLVTDPERFPDASEPANAFGRGAVYTHTCSGAPLRTEPYPRTADLLENYFRPYADAVTDAVDRRLSLCGRTVIIDLHSYPAAPSGFENPTAARPALCIGTDPVHTPPWLIDTTRSTFACLTEITEIAENTPYAGTYVPLRHYSRDERVMSVMIELRRDIYLADPRTPDRARVNQLGRTLAGLIDVITEQVADDV